jgi:hypothetical protein
MIGWLKREYPDFFVWLALGSAAVILFFVSFGTTCHQFAIGLLTSAVAWLLLITLFECAWQLVTAALHHLGVEISETMSSGSPGSRSRLQRGDRARP